MTLNKGRNTGGKRVVLGVLERGKTIRTAVIEDRKNASIRPVVRENVERALRSFRMSTRKIGAWIRSTSIKL